jgi:SulP family sulfate permease
LEENFPAAEEARQAVVIFLLRGYDEFGATMIGVLSRYARTVQGNGGKVMLAGVSEGLFSQLERTGLLQLIGRDNVFMAQAQWGVAANQALEAAQGWLDAIDRPAKGTA